MSSSYNSQRCYSSSALSTDRLTDPSWPQNSRELRGRSNRSHPSARYSPRTRINNTPSSTNTTYSSSYDPFVERMTRSGSSLMPGESSYVHIDYRPGTSSPLDASTTFGTIDKDMQKKLVDACVRGDVDVTDRLIRLGANPNYSNDEGTLKPSVYYASRHGHFHLLVRLIERHNCNAHYKTPRGTTLLHLACLHGHDDIVKYLTSSSIQLDPSAKNRLGSTPLHLACVGGHPHIVQYLIENLHCDPRCVGEPDEETPLHTACTKGHLGIMKYLIEVQKCDPFHPTRVGETPLHLACQHGHKDIVVYLITEQHCDPMVQDLRQNTPLHSAAQQNHPDIVYYLIMEQGCNPYARNQENCTPLHLACRYSRINVVKVLLEKAKISASIPGPNGQTPIQITYDYDVVKNLIRHGANPKEAQVNIFPNIPPQQLEDTIVRILVVGDPSSGKSTLVEALKTQPRGFLGMPPRGRITDVEPYTAGIIPHDIKNNPEFGHVLLFDFAGHSEYYSSHSVVIDSVCASPPIFIVVVDLSKDEERIKLRLHFWIQFIENNRPSFVSKPHIVVVGSHDDILTGYDINYRQRMIANIRKFAKEAIESTSLQFSGFFHVNCQKVSTQTDLRHVLAKSCRSVRAHIQDDNLCHAFSVYLIAMFNGRIMVTLREIADVVRQSDSAFPFEYEKLCKLCESLGTKVNVMFIRNPHNIRESTVILEVNLLLSKIHGVMFAPQGFKEHKLNSQNGIVTFSRLKKVFKGMDPRVIAQCMQRLEFCQEVQDPSILNLIRGRPITTALSPISPQEDEIEHDGFGELNLN